MTAYRVFSEGNYRIPRLFWDPPIEFRIHLCTGKLQRRLSVLLSYFSIIENADATPPHLGVILRLVSSDGVHGSLQFFAVLCIWVAQLFFVNCTCTPAWNVDMLKACMSESSTETNVSSPDAS